MNRDTNQYGGKKIRQSLTKASETVQYRDAQLCSQQNNITKQLNQKHISILHPIFHRVAIKCCFVA